jgi:CelD/BcsL family acetyltransferase involved in cellulose biosynthesis
MALAGAIDVAMRTTAPGLRVRVARDLGEIPPEVWERLRAEGGNRPALTQQRPWVAEELPEREGARFVLALRDGAVVGAVPLLVSPWRWPLRIGYRTLVRFPLLTGRLCGPTLLGPDTRDEDRHVHEALLGALVGPDVGCDLIILEGVPTASMLAGALRTSALSRGFHVHRPAPASARRFVRLAASIDEYLAKFGGKTRRKLKNSMKRFDEQGRVEMTRVTTEAEVPRFLDAADALSRASWQGRKLGKVVEKNDATAEWLRKRARRGALRSYLLSLDGAPVAFVLGTQIGDVYDYAQIGFDPRFAEHSPGKILLLKVLEDLFAWNKPAWMDFGNGDAEYKQTFANVSHEEEDVYLVRRGAYPSLVWAAEEASTRGSWWVRGQLDRYGVREKVRRFLRRSGSAASSAKGATKDDEMTESGGAP